MNTTTTTTTVLWPFVWDYPGEPVPEETFTHPPSWSSNLYQLLPSTTIHSILTVQITCLTVFLHNLSMSSLVWSHPRTTSYSIHFFTQSVSSFRSTGPYHRNLFCCSINIISSIPSPSLNSLLGTLPFTLTLHIHLTTHLCWKSIKQKLGRPVAAQAQYNSHSSMSFQPENKLENPLSMS